MNTQIPDTGPASSLDCELSDVEKEAFSKIANLMTLKDGDILLEEGHCDACMYLVRDGELAVIKSAGQGDEQVISLLKPGDFTGAMGCIDGHAHSATLRANGKAEVYRIERGQFEKLIGEQPMLVYKIMRAVVCMLHETIRRMNTNHVEFTNYITKLHGRY